MERKTREGVITICKDARFVELAAILAKKFKLITPIEKVSYIDADTKELKYWVISVLGKTNVVEWLEKISDIKSDEPGVTFWLNIVTGKMEDVVPDMDAKKLMRKALKISQKTLIV